MPNPFKRGMLHSVLGTIEIQYPPWMVCLSRFQPILGTFYRRPCTKIPPLSPAKVYPTKRMRNGVMVRGRTDHWSYKGRVLGRANSSGGDLEWRFPSFFWTGPDTKVLLLPLSLKRSNRLPVSSLILDELPLPLVLVLSHWATWTFLFKPISDRLTATVMRT